MIAVSQAFRDAVRLGKPQRAVLKFEDATFTNEDISMTSGGITFYERFNESTDLTVGVAPSSGIRVTMINRDGKLNDFKFGKFTAAIGACVEEKTYTRDDVNGKTLVPVAGKPYKISYESDTVTEWWGNWTKRVYELVKLGTFIAPRPAVIRKYVVTVEADDQMTLFDEMWAKDLPVQYPVTLGGLLSAICKEAGVTLKSTSFLNSDMTVEEEPEDFENATVREVVAWIAEAACGYARFDRDGLLEIVWFNPTTQQYDEHDYTDFTPYSYQVQPVQQLNIRNQNSNAEAILGEGENAYMIQDNPFLRQDDGTEAETITGEPARIMQVPGSASDAPSPIAAESGIKSISGNADRADSEPAPIAAESGITPIYNRLAGFAPFNPSSVDLLTDWSVQAGDMVNVASGADTYSLPVYSMTMNWNGSPKITLESSGNEIRDPLPKFERQLFSAGHGGYGNALAVQDLKNWAEITIDEEHALIVEQAGRLDEQGNKIVTAERRLDGIDETITDMAGTIDEHGNLIEGAQQEIDGIHETITQQAGKLDEQGKLISGAQRQIDGINKSIEDIAGDIDQIDGTLTGVRSELDGINQTITDQAGKIDAQGKLISGAEEKIDGINKTITDIAGDISEIDGTLTGVRTELDGINQTITEQAGTITAQGELISGAQEEIDGLNKSITDIAGDIDEVTGDLSGVRTRLDGAEKTITEQAGKISKQGELIEGVQLVLNGAEGEAGLIARMGDAESALTVASNEIKAEVKRATGAEDSLSSRVKVTEDNITAQSGKIDKQGELIEGVQLTLDGDSNTVGLVARMKTAETSIKANTDAIALRATKKDMEAQFTVQADKITSVVKSVDGYDENGKHVDGLKDKMAAAEKNITDAQTEITQTKEDIKLKANATVVDALTGRMEKAESSIEVNATAITQRVKAGDIASTINQTAQSVLIQASKIDLKGYVTATSLETDYLSAIRGDFNHLTSGTLRAKNLASDGFTGDHMQLSGNATITGDLTIHGFDFDLHRHQIVDNQDGTFSIGNPGWANINSFRIADTKTYKDGVSAAKNSVKVTGSWSSGIYTARTDAPIPQSHSTYISGTATGEYDATNHRYNLSAPVLHSTGPGSPTSETGYTIKGTTDTTAYDTGYNAGKSAGESGVKLDNGTWSKGIFTVKMTNAAGTELKSASTQISGTATPTYDSTNHKYSISAPVKYGDQGQGDTGQTITGTTGTEAYEAGVSAGVGSVKLDNGTWSKGIFTVKMTNSAGSELKSASTKISGTATATYNEATHKYSISAPVKYGDQGQNDTGQTITGTSDTKAYEAGYAAGEKSGSGVTVDSIPKVDYNPDYKNFTVTIKLTNGTEVQKIVNGLDAYNAGAASVSVTEDTSHIKWQTTVRKIGSIDGKVTVVLSNGNEYSRSVTSITAPAVRNVNVNTVTDKVTVYYANVTSGYTSSDVFDW